jgi:hypothetical protein
LVPFSCFVLLDSFSSLSSASGVVFKFSAPRLIFGDTEGVGSRFHFLSSRSHFRRCRVRRVHIHVLRSRTRFQRYRGCRVPLSCFARPNSFSAVPRASDPVFMFSAPEHVFGGTEGVVSRFHVLRSRNLFRRCRVRRVLFSCFELPDSFSAVPRASGPVFMICAPRLIFGGTEGAVSQFHALRSRTRFRRYRGRRVPFSCFALADSFSAVPRESDPVFMF